MKILLLAVSLSCLGACRMPMNKKPDWTRAPEPRNDARAVVAADIPSEIDLAATARCVQIATLPTTNISKRVSTANADAALGLSTRLSP